MSNFSVSFQVQGTGSVVLPVTPLDSLILQVAGLVTSTFRFSVQNTLSRDVSLVLTSVTSGPGANKVAVSVDLPVLAIPTGESATVTTTVTPSQDLVEGDLISVTVNGVEAV